MRFVETNIFLYVITANPDFGQTAKEILQRIELEAGDDFKPCGGGGLRVA